MNRSTYRSYVVMVSRRLLVWLLMGLGIWVVEAPYSKPDEQAYSGLIGLIVWGLTILVYELYAHWLFVKYLYQGRWGWFLGISVGILSLINGLLYGSYSFIREVANVSPGNLTDATHPYLTIWATIYRGGIMGWLTDVHITGLILDTPYFFASPFLIVQLFRHYLAQRRQTQQSELNNLALNRENTALELDLLKAQVNPHFLFNSLNSIYVRVIDVDDSAADLVLRLAELMRYNLYEADASSVALDQELGYIENYLQLEQTRHGQRVEIIFTKEGDFRAFQIAPLLLLAFVENAFKHGIGGTQQEAYVWVEAHMEPDSTLVFTVQNSLTTLAQSNFPDRKSGGVGLPNVRQRLAMLYPQAFQIETEQTADSYAVTLTLHLMSQPSADDETKPVGIRR